MAMEKLILRSVMYGADKIPDKWFEKIPGGYYKAKEEEAKVKKREAKDKRIHGDEMIHKSQRESRRDGQRNGDDRSGQRNGDNRDDHYRSDDGRHRDRRSRSSYDGGADADDNPNPYRRRDLTHGSRHNRSSRRRHSVDSDRYGYNDGYGRPSRDGYDDDRRPNGQPPYPTNDDRDRNRQPSAFRSRRPDTFDPGPFAAGAAARAGTAAGEARGPRANPMQPPSQNPQYGQPRAGSVAGGYVPYSNIYGESNQGSPRQSYSPQLPSDGPGYGYQQNPYAQDAPTAAAAGAGAFYDGRPEISPPDPRWANEHDPRYNSRRGNAGYDENSRPHSESPSPDHRRSRQDHSPSRSSYDSREDDRRQRNDRNSKPQSQNHGRSKSAFGARFDKSQRGLGYSAVGAVAGGMVGSEFGKGVVPKAIGAAIGGFGANAFQARERYVDPRHPLTAQVPVQRSSPSSR